jgi:ferredoxin
MKTPTVELSDCVQCGICVEVCPSVFYLNAAGYIEVIGFRDCPEAEVDEAIRVCPADCISWQDV